MKYIWKSKRFMIGLLYLIAVMSASFIYTYGFQADIPKPPKYIYGDKGQIIGTHPASPLLYPPMGTGRFGDQIFLQVLEGAKFTISLAIGIALIRLFSGVICGVMLSLYTKKLKPFFRYFGEMFHYIPTIFTAFILIAPVMYAIHDNRENVSPNIPLLLYEAAVAVFVVWPSLSLYVSDEIDTFMKKEYMVSARLLGASRRHLIRRHLSVLFQERLLLLFIQHAVQTLILFTHMGLLQLFIGGVQYKELYENDYRPVSLSNEWSGLIGLNYFEANLKPWVVLGPLFAFALTIFFLNLMAAGLKAAMEKRERVLNQSAVEEAHTDYEISEQSFTFAKGSAQSIH
ncbi:ABC transporter permease subunit [Ectobacillus ponti]|uniref:ABC transporter permease subunit n=1 Tax=Ectobacillus ponti TaxID=2961894 RepID=A0AA41X577_9BACI|nr:ABC transporter permease subunit [Ectobacillus ponti]MCP8968917.1 ABC transporter permease subunit [Ectobacillus ponti]